MGIKMEKVTHAKVKNIILFILLFLIIFKIRIFSYDAGKVIICFAVLYLILNYQRTCGVIREIGGAQIVLFLTIGMFWTLGTVCRDIAIRRNTISNYMSPRELLYTSFYVLVLPLFFCLAFESFENFSKSIILNMILQSVVVLTGLFLPPVKSFLMLWYSGNKSIISHLKDFWIGYGINVRGASGSTTLFMGHLLLVCLMMNKKLKYWQFFCSYMFILSAELLVGRTGLYLGVAMLFFYIFYDKRLSVFQKNIVRFTTSILIIAGAACIVLYFYNQRLFEHWWTRVLEIFTLFSKSSTSKGFFTAFDNMSHPKLSWETLLGTNVIRGVSYRGTIFQNDSGYWQKYFALGIVGAILYYASYFVLLAGTIKRCRKPIRTILWFALLMLFVIEYKEPFFSYQVYPFIIMTVAIMDIKEKKNMPCETIARRD